MEAIGAIASIATLITVAKEVSEITLKLARSLYAAPRELVQLQNHTCLVFLALQSLKEISNNAGSRDILSEEELWVFNQALTTAKHDMLSIHKQCTDIGANNTASRHRLRWSLIEKSRATECLQQLQRVESSLAIILQSTNLKVALKTSLLLRHRMEETIAMPDNSVTSTGYAKSAIHFPVNQSLPIAERRNAQACKSVTGAFELDGFWTSLFDCACSVAYHTEDAKKTYYCQVRLNVPTLAGHMALIIMVFFRRSLPRWHEYDILGGRLRFVSYASDEVVSACIRGDFIAVRDAILDAKAAPTDVSRHGNSLLWYAAQSGSMELVNFLVQGGAAVLPNLILFAAYWRKPELARLCFHNGIDPDVMSSDGLTAPMYLYGAGRKPQSQTEFLDILICNSCTGIGRQDKCGWSILHRAAAFGTREDVKALLATKVDRDVATYNLAWNALFSAVCHNNYETMEELWSIYRNPQQMTDLRGWNLLHVAAAAGNFEAIPFLVEHGVELDGMSKVTSRLVPPPLENQRLTPSDIARAYGEVSYQVWCNTLKSCGRTANPSSDDIDWNGSEAKPQISYGGCECCDTWEFQVVQC